MTDLFATMTCSGQPTLQKANQFHRSGRISEAEICYRQLIELETSDPTPCLYLGALFEEQNRWKEAVDCYRLASERDPRNPTAYRALGNGFLKLGQKTEAIDSLRKAVALRPDYAQAWGVMGNVYAEMGDWEAAISCYSRVVNLDPRNYLALWNLGIAFQTRGEINQSITYYQQALAISPNAAVCHSNLLTCLQYSPSHTIEMAWQEALQFGHRHSPPGETPQLTPNDPNPCRRLRIGYVSGDFCNHPVGYFLESIIEHHNRDSFEIFCYSNNVRDDDTTLHLRNKADNWRTITPMDDDSARGQILQDRIDILVDLSGHTAKNRLIVFARRAAPIQITWLGYFATTGLSAMDYILADRYVIPPAEERYYIEKVIRMPDSYLCFKPPHFDIDTGSLPCLKNGFVTFGCFNTLSKIQTDVIRAWTEILHEIPHSIFFLKTAALDNPHVVQKYKTLFQSNGISPERLRLEGRSPRNELLASYNAVDIALDPFPFNGGTTTAESLWMGVPVLTLRGDRFVGHVGESILTPVGLENWIADSKESYCQKAITFASHTESLSDLRKRLRQTFMDSPLCNGSNFTLGLETAYRQMWEHACRTIST